MKRSKNKRLPQTTSNTDQNGKVIDPTENVKALSESANQRQDDLREQNDRLFNARLGAVEANIGLRAEHTKELSHAESIRVNEQLSLRSIYEERLALAEAKRIDAIRAVDVNAVGVASQRAADQASVLATQVAQSAEQLRTQVAQSAEALRSLVATTANTVANSQQQLATSLSTRITTLEQAQYEGKGKQSFADPAFAELLNEVKSLRDSRATVTGKTEGVGNSWQVFLGVGGLIAAFLMSGYILVNRSSSPPSPPEIIQVAPAPAPTLAAPAPRAPAAPIISKEIQ